MKRNLWTPFLVVIAASFGLVVLLSYFVELQPLIDQQRHRADYAAAGLKGISPAALAPLHQAATAGLAHRHRHRVLVPVRHRALALRHAAQRRVEPGVGGGDRLALQAQPRNVGAEGEDADVVCHSFASGQWVGVRSAAWTLPTFTTDLD